jgi:type I restriction enzyme M protein
LVLANPPYSISQWDRNAFTSDKYGRNFLGVPPQSRADYAFIQHILKSMDEKSGRCAILLPHGVLFRNEEQSIRENLIKSDLLECVIGIGKNLFFNSPMEACIMICRSKKPASQVGKVLFINAKDLVTRCNSFSYLDDEHIDKIASAYKNFTNKDKFCSVVTWVKY